MPSEDIVFNIGADISQFEASIKDAKNQYTEAQKEFTEKGVNYLGNEESSFQAYNYMLDTLNSAHSVLSEMSAISTSLPQGMQKAMNILLSGAKSSLGSLSSYVGQAGTKITNLVNVKEFNNQLRFNSASLTSYIDDLKKAVALTNAMSAETKNVLGSRRGELASVIDPAISHMFTKHHRELKDSEIVSEFLNGGEEYSYVKSTLEKMGLTQSKDQKDAIQFMLKTSKQRINRQDVQKHIFNAGLESAKRNVFATDVVRPTYQAAYVSGGRFLGNDKTPRSTERSDRISQLAYYEGIKNEILRGNSVAYKAAKEAKIISEEGGQYRFLDNKSISDRILNQFSGLVIGERKHAAEGSPQYRRDLLDPENAYKLIEKENRRIAESDRLINLDDRKNANPYAYRNYNKRLKKELLYEQGDENLHVAPELSIPEMINIPRMAIRNDSGTTRLMVKRYDKNSGNTVYEPNLNYEWQKKGIRETPYDEWITMGRNPILDRLIKMHKDEGASFTDRTFGYGFDSNDVAKKGTPLIISTSVNDLRDKDKWGNIKFIQTELENGKPGPKKAYFPNNAGELIDKLNTGVVMPVMKDENGNDVEYRMFAGHTTGNGSMLFMRNTDFKRMEDKDKARGLTSMLRYFNEIDENGDLINPETGYAFRRNPNDKKTEEELAAYRRYYDARNKGLSHSLPIEEAGSRTPLAALVNFGAFYSATNTPKNEQFDGGGFIDPSIYSKDFQARMGPAKFLAQRLNWRQFLSDAGFTYTGHEGKDDTAEHFYMPGMSAAKEDYIKYRERNKQYLAGTMSDKEADEFRTWRDARFVDVMDPKYGALLADSTLKGSPLKSGLMTAEAFDQIVRTVREKNPDSAFLKDRIVKPESEYDKNIKEHKEMIKLTPAQQTELMNMYADPEYGFGLRIMKDTENYAGNKDFWSPAYMSSVRVTPAMLARSADAYAKAFEQLSTPQGIIERMFSGNDYDSRRVRQNPGLIYSDDDLKYRIASEREDLEMKQLLGYGYFPGSSRMMVAGVNPFSLFNPIGVDISGREASSAVQAFNTGRHGVIANSVNAENGARINWTRSPYAPGANFFANALRSDALKRYGLTSDSALFNISDFYELNTGDFDGDFVWAQTALASDNDFQRLTEERNKGVLDIAERLLKEKDLEKRIKEKKKTEPDFDPKSFSAALNTQTESSSGPTGLGYKVAQAFRMGLFTADEIAEMDAYGNDTYQVGIDMAKHVDAKVRDASPTVQKAIGTRKPYERLTKALIEEYENGTSGATDIFAYGLPTYVDPISSSILASAKTGRDSSISYGKKMEEMIRANVNARYGEGSINAKNLANWYANLLIAKSTGKFQLTSEDTLQQGQNYLSNLGDELNRLQNQYGLNDPKVQELRSLYSHANSAIETERNIGYTENNLDAIKEHAKRMNWKNYAREYGFRTELDARVADIEYERVRDKRQQALEEAHESQVSQAIEASGRADSPSYRKELTDRILAAELYTGFNWSNAKYFTDRNLDFPNEARYVSLDDSSGKKYGKTTPHQGPITTSFLYDSEKNKAQIARRILTGETRPDMFMEAHALVGTAAHEFMHQYGLSRQQKDSTRDKAEAEAEEAFRSTLLGQKLADGTRQLSEEQKKEQARANISFTEKDGAIIAHSNNEKLRLAIQEKLDKADFSNKDNNSLLRVSRNYYEDALSGVGGTHMIMSEGQSFEWNDAEKRAKPVSDPNRHGIYIVPTRDGKHVIDFQRTRVDSRTGRTEKVDAGTYFTPDMIKMGKNGGGITIADWKSGSTGQEDALFQTAYYAHLLEEKGKEYWLGSRDPKLQEFAKYVSYNKDTGEFTSNIKRLEAINMFAEDPSKAVLQADYDMALGDAVAKWVEGGYKNLSTAAKLGFVNELKGQSLKVNFLRTAMGLRPTLPPGADENEYRRDDVSDEELNRYMERFAHFSEIAGGGTGIKDAEGKYIDQDKAFLVQKYKDDENKLNEIRSFTSKQYRKLNNVEFDTRDDFTRNIEAIGDLFTTGDYDTLMKYYGAGQFTAPDVQQMQSRFNVQQIEASNQLKRILELRSQYHEQMFDTMESDYNDIVYGEGDSVSKLRAINRKYQKDTSIINEERMADKYYNPEVLGGFATDMESHYIEPVIQRRENETDEQFNNRREAAIKQAQQNARDEAAIRAERAKKYSNEEINAKNYFDNATALVANEIIASRQTEQNPLLSVLKSGTFEDNIHALNKKAQSYQEFAAMKNGNGKNVFSDDIIALFRQEYDNLISQAEMLSDVQKNNPVFTSLINSRKEYNKAAVNAKMTGERIDPKLLENSAMLSFASEYLNANNNATPEDIVSAINQYRDTYQREEETRLGFRPKADKLNYVKQREYAKAKTEEANREYAQAMEFAEMFKSPDMSEQDQEEINKMIREAEEKKSHAASLTDQAERNAQLDKYQNENNTLKTVAMLEGRSLTAEEQRKISVNNAISARERYINEQLLRDESFNADAFRQKYSKSFYEGAYDNNLQTTSEVNRIARENQTNAVEREIARRQRSVDYSQADFERQRRRAQSVTMLGRNLSTYENRRIQLERSNVEREDKIAALKDANKKIDEDLKNKSLTDEQRKNLESNKENNIKQIEGYRKEITDTEGQIKSLSGAQRVLSAATDTVSQAVGRLAQRFGRRLFMKAYQEAIQFVKQFDTAMTSIQMITLKTDEQMSTLGDGLIDKAKELKVSISDITKSAETLYRQGLSDDEVNDRLEVISKFSKVSGTKVDDATKLITIAMNTGLVTDASYAADVVTALGDNAATNAAQIEKGIEKAGAAAAADGTTFEELTAMLTAITSTTQIGGNVAGRTLNTIFGRMNKIGTNELIYDENGNAISGSAVAKLLEAQGVKMYDENGNKRSSYSTLYELSQKWESMSDAEQQQIANAIAGTRQYSNYAAIMQGISEGKVDEYMGTIAGSEGIVDKKYEVYTKSLQASLTDLKNTYDELVHDMTSSGTLTGALKSITGMIQGVDNLTNSFGGLGAMLTTVLPMLVGLTLLSTGMRTGNLAMAGIGLGAAVIGSAVASGAGNGNATTASERHQNNLNSINDFYSGNISKIAEAKELRDKGAERTIEETQRYTELISSLASTFNLEDPTKSAEEFASSLDSVSAAAENAAKHSKEYADVIDKADESNEEERIRKLANDREWAAAAAKEHEDTLEQSYTDVAIDSITLKDFFPTDSEGNIVINYDDFKKTASKGDALRDNSDAADRIMNDIISVPVLGDLIEGAGSFIDKKFDTGMTSQSYWKHNKEKLATLMTSAMAANNLPSELRSQLDEGGYFGYSQKDWEDYFDKLHNGKDVDSTPLEALEHAANLWLGGEDTTQNKLKASEKNQFISSFKQFAPWLSEEQLDAMGDKAQQEFVYLTNSGMNSETAFARVRNSALGLTEGDYSRKHLEESVNAYIGPVSSGSTSKVSYRGEIYDSDEKAAAAKSADYESYKETHGITSINVRSLGDAEYEDSEQYFNNRRRSQNEAVNKGLSALLEESFQNGYYLNGQLYTQDEISDMYQNFKTSSGNEVTVGKKYLYTDSNGKTTESNDADEIERIRNTDYVANAIRTASETGAYSRISRELKDSPELINDAIIRWYSDKYGVSYDDFSNTHGISSEDVYSYRGNQYLSKDDVENARLNDFWGGEDINEHGVYVIDGKQYTTKAAAIEGGRAYLERQWEINHPVQEEETKFIYNGEEYDTAEAAEAQRKKDYDEAEEYAITAATEEEIEALNPFHAGTATGLTAFNTKNEYALRADTMRRNLAANNVSDITSLIDYVKGEGAANWKYLTENNGEFARLIDSVQFDEQGNVINPEVYDQIIASLRTNGRDLGAQVRSSAEKGAIAQGVFNSIQKGEAGYLSIEDARAAAERQAKQEYDEYEAGIDAQAEEWAKHVTGHTEEAKESYKAELRKANPFKGQTAEQIAAGYRVYTDEEKTYLKEALGENLSQRILEGKASQSEKTYAARVLDNISSGISSGLTSSQKLEGINEILQYRDTYDSLYNYDKDAAKQYLSGWSGAEEYLALASQEGLDDNEIERLKVLEKSLENFKRNAEISIEIEGVKEAEEAGEVLEGTASTLEKLKKGGKFEIEAMLSITAETFEHGQQVSKLFSGSVSEQDETAMSVLGMGRDQYYANRETNLAWAQSVMDSKHKQFIESQNKYYDESIKYSENEQSYLDWMASQGYTWDADNGTFVGSGNVGVTNIGSLVGTTRSYTDIEKSSMLDRILSGEAERTVGEGGNSELYDAAIESAGEATLELLRRKANKETIEPWLENASNAERREALWSRGGSLFATRNQAVLANQAVLGSADNEENISTIASYLSMDEDQVKSMMKAGKSDDLSKLISDKTDAAFEQARHELETEFNIELSSENWDDLATELETATADADEAVKERVAYYTNAMREAANVLTPEEAIEKYSSWGRDQKDAEAITSIQNAVSEGMTWDQLKSQIIGEGLTFKTDADFSDFLSRNTGVAEVLEKAETSGFTSELLNSLMQISPRAILNADTNYQEQYSKWIGLQNGQGGIDISGLTDLVGSDDSFREWLSQFDDLQDALKDAQSMTNGTSTAFKKLHAEMYAGLIKSLRPWGDATDDIVDSAKKASKSIKGQSDAAKSLRSSTKDISDNQASREKIRSGKGIDSEAKSYLESLGFDKKDLKDKTKRQSILDALDLDEEADKETLSEELTSYYMDLGETLSALSESEKIDILGPEVVVEGGTITMNNQEILDRFSQILTEQQRQYIEEAISKGIEIEWAVSQTGDTVAITPKVKSLGGGRRSSSKSGGGSGKSATDKTIEKVENRETKAKHKVTMAQLVQEHYGFTNEYQNQVDAIYDEVSAQKGLLDVYEDNLSLLEAQQDAVTTYSDDWWKLEKQILSTQESIQETKNTIESLDSKVIEVVTAKQENEDRPYTHTRNMINSYVDRYQTIYESGGTMSEAAAYNKWVTNKNLQTDSIRQQINQNKEQITEWQELLSKIDENNDNYETVKDNIWALQEENAELENELLSQEIELNEARLSRIAQVLQNTNSRYEHEINMSDTQGQIYQINRDYSGYRQELANQRANYQNQIKPYQDAITSIREQMATLTPYSAAWYSARDSLYEYEEALEQLSLSIEETDQALRESYLNELFENIDKVNTAAEYRMTGLQERTRNSKLAGDNKNYVKNLDKERLEIVKEITEQQNALDDLINLKNSGKIKKGTAEWDELLNKIKEVQNNMSKLENDAAEKYQETAAASLQGIVDKYGERTRDTNHAMDILKTQESEYRSSGEYTNLKTNLNAQYDLEKQRNKELKAERKELVKELSRYGEGSFEYNNVLKQIQSVDKELATSNNTLKSLKKSADEVDKQMLKATASYENYVHNMYKSIVQQQKDQLNATVSMQNTVLEAIKKSYQEQWNLIKKDIDKKKQALQEEKNIIQERLNARKQAEQQTDKEEQLAELQKQLMIIEADPTRTKKAKELRKQIDDLQKELSGNLADNLASAETKRIDDAIKGMSQYQSNTEEDMNDYLKDANNFKTVFDNLFSGSEEAFYEFMEEINASDMKNKTAEQIEQLKNSWHDQWLKMNGEVETYWEEVASSIKITEDNRKQVRKQLLKLLKQTNAYKSAGEAGRQQQIAEIDDYIESAVNAKKVSAEAGDPTIAILGDTNAKIEELKSNTYKTLLDESAQAKLSAIANAVTGSKKYIGGGLVNYTGIARVDGTPSRPEAFLDAEDTANIRAMLDQFSYVKTMPFMSHIDGGMFGGTSNSIGDVNITINQAELSSDQDIEALAGKVGQAFTRELSKRGFNTASYAF